MKTISSAYYEQSTLWKSDRTQGPAGRVRLKETIAIIPPDVRSILDVGCGNGFLVNALCAKNSDRFDKITGLDPSEEALSYVKCEKVRGSASHLPFGNSSYDLVTALEVLEHLPENEFRRALTEIQRVARRFIIVSVPNNEDLHRQLVMCPKCCCCYNPCFHLRSFNREKLAIVFRKFQPIHIEEVGPPKTKRLYGRVLGYAYQYHKLFLRQVWPPAFAICPQCGYQHHTGVGKASYNAPWTGSSKLLTLGVSLLNLMIRKTTTKPYLLALYMKRG